MYMFQIQNYQHIWQDLSFFWATPSVFCQIFYPQLLINCLNLGFQQSSLRKIKKKKISDMPVSQLWPLSKPTSEKEFQRAQTHNGQHTWYILSAVGLPTSSRSFYLQLQVDSGQERSLEGFELKTPCRTDMSLTLWATQATPIGLCMSKLYLWRLLKTS